MSESRTNGLSRERDSLQQVTESLQGVSDEAKVRIMKAAAAFYGIDLRTAGKPSTR